MNPLTDIIPGPVRRWLYAAYALAGIIVGALAIGGLEVGKAPDVLAYLGSALGIVAASNISSAGDEYDRPDYDPADDDA